MGNTKRFTCFLMISCLWLVGCATTQTFNADGTETIPVTFSYPAHWHHLELPDGILIVFPPESEYTINEDGYLEGFPFKTAILIYPVPEQTLLELFEEEKPTEVELLKRDKWAIEKIILAAATHGATSEPSPQNETEVLREFLQSMTNPIGAFAWEIVEPPYTTQIGTRDAALMKKQIVLTDFGSIPTPIATPEPFGMQWDVAITEEGQFIRVLGTIYQENEVGFLEFFNQIITTIHMTDQNEP